MAKRLTVDQAAISGLILLSAVALLVVGFSLFGLIDSLSGWIYVGLLMIVFLSLVVVFLSPTYIETNIPGIGPVSIDGSNSTERQTEEGSVSSPDGFEDYAELTRSLSTDLSNQLYQIEDAGYTNPFEATSAIISDGLESKDRNPVQDTMEILESDLEAREFILNSDNHDMAVVDIDNERVIARLDDDQHPPKPGLEFKLFANTAVDVEGTTETFGEWVGTVRVEEVDDPLCVMRVISWDEELSDDPAQRSTDLTRRGAWVEIGLEEAESIDWDAMEEAHQKLKSLQEQGELNYAN